MQTFNNSLVIDLLAAQRTMDCRAESLAIQALFPIHKSAGRQHSVKSLKNRILECTQMGATDCWHWCGNTNKFGYGRFSYQGRAQMAHRLSFRAFVGAIPKGLSVLHTCDNPSCVNPRHLWLGTYADNRRDCLSKGRWRLMRGRSGFDHQCNKVSPEMLSEMKRLRTSGESYSKIAEAVGVAAMTVWKALNKRFGRRS
jgi:hypothetical protein